MEILCLCGLEFQNPSGEVSLLQLMSQLRVDSFRVGLSQAWRVLLSTIPDKIMRSTCTLDVNYACIS